MIDSLQLGDKYKITTPANWKKGEDVIVHPSVQGEKVKELFGDDVKTVYVSHGALCTRYRADGIPALPSIHPGPQQDQGLSLESE